MRKRESRAVCLSVVITLLIVAPAFAIVPTPYGSFGHVYELNGGSWKTNDTGTAGGWSWTEWNDTGSAWAQSGGSITHSNTLDDTLYLDSVTLCHPERATASEGSPSGVGPVGRSFASC